ncbi:MAG: DUF2478 domain-containing protein [Paracoccus sp. (in: a-proteobacteria)]
MLGWLDYDEAGGGDAVHLLMRNLAATLPQEGIALRGAVQVNDRNSDDCRCAMTLHILGDNGPDIVISQNLGQQARGCRLDPGALEQATQRVLDTLPDAAMVIVNKFGKQELAGRGMVAVIAAAIERDLPVLTSVAADQRTEFETFAGDMAVRLHPEDVPDWCRHITGRITK